MELINNTAPVVEYHMQQNDISSFSNPSSEYHPVVFWSWNEKMDINEVRHQLRQMKAAGLGGGFIHSRIGLLTEYLGSEWFEAVRATIEESKKLGFKVYLYDEDKWPSGFAGGAVPLANEAYRMKALLARPANQPVPDGYTVFGPSDSGLQVYRWVSPLGYDWFNGTCYADLMSREAMQYFVEQSYQSYYDRFSEYYGDSIVQEFTDEPCTIFRGRLPEGAVPYSNELPVTFNRLHGYDPVPHLYKLFVNTYGAERFRIHYFRTVNYLFENNFSKQIADWCSSHKIGLTGHYMYETTMYGQQLWGTKVMANYRHQHQPGIDHLGRQIDEIISAKQCQSVVNQAGKKRMMSEMFGCSGQGVTFEDRLWIATQQIQLGVNFINPHLSLYTMAGCRKRDFPPNLFYQQPWWPVNKAVDIPLSRLCYAMSQGRYAADTLVIHPQESTFALWQSRSMDCKDMIESNYLEWDNEPTEKGVKDKIKTLDKQFNKILSALLHNQVQYDLGDETLIAQESAIESKDGKAIFNLGQMSYTTVILPSMYTISPQTLDRLRGFQKIGGRIYRCGQGPFVVDGQKSEELDRFLASLPNYDLVKMTEQIKQASSVQIRPRIGGQQHLWMHLRNLKDGSVLMLLSNLTRSERFEGQLIIKAAYSGVWLLDHWTGQKIPVVFKAEDGKTIVNLSLEAVQSHLLLLDAESPSQTGIQLCQAIPEKTVLLDPARIQVHRLDDNALTLDTARWALGDATLSPKAMPLIVLQEMLNEQRYAGELTLEYTFNTKGLSKDRNIRLVLEHPEYCRIRVNGKECRYEGLAPWLDIRFMPIDISDKVCDGLNTVTFEYAKFIYGDKTSITDTFARYGTEIESIYIVGDFAVQGQFVSPVYDNTYWKQWNLPPELIALKADVAFITDPVPLKANKLTESGLPFYAGRVEYTVALPEMLLKPGQRRYVKFEKLNAACAEVFVDEVLVGTILTRPYGLDITESYKLGKRLRIVLYSTLRNLLGPHHHPDGEVVAVSPLSFLPQTNPGQTWSQLVNDWQEGKTKPSGWQDDYCLVDFGNIADISLSADCTFNAIVK